MTWPGLTQRHTDTSGSAGLNPLSGELAGLLAFSGGHGLSTQQILDRMSARGVALLMVLFSAPFLLPISIPGTSTPFGVMLAVMGLTMVLNRPPWVPHFLGDRVVPHRSLEKVVTVLLKVFGRLERWLRVRHAPLVTTPWLLRVNGIYVAFMALVLALPLPPFPFFASNSIAAWPIFLLGLGLLERDGLLVACAYLWVLPFITYWLVIAAVSAEALDYLAGYWHHVEGWGRAVWEAVSGWF